MITPYLKKIAGFAALGLIFSLACPSAQAASRIKDIADFEGVRENQLVGYGLVVGLNGTGDNVKSIDFTKESLVSMLDQIGINARGGQIKAKNIAAVMVTANFPPFGRQGSRIDVMVSAMGDAKNLQGGTLIATPLVGADGNVYAKRIGTLVTYYYHSTDWKNNATYEIMYGDITSRPEYKPHMMRLQVTENYTVNSKGESVPIHEVAWGDENDEPTHLYLQFTSSHGGAYVGSSGNSLWIDNVKLVY